MKPLSSTAEQAADCCLPVMFPSVSSMKFVCELGHVPLDQSHQQGFWPLSAPVSPQESTWAGEVLIVRQHHAESDRSLLLYLKATQTWNNLDLWARIKWKRVWWLIRGQLGSWTFVADCFTPHRGFETQHTNSWSLCDSGALVSKVFCARSGRATRSVRFCEIGIFSYVAPWCYENTAYTWGPAMVMLFLLWSSDSNSWKAIAEESALSIHTYVSIAFLHTGISPYYF